MKVLVQRVSCAKVCVGDQVTGLIGRGLVLLVGIERDDTEFDTGLMADKCLSLRIFDDQAGRMNLSVMDVGGGLLAISQFTLCADTRKGRRPSFLGAAPPDLALPLFDSFVASLRKAQVEVATGRFGAMMMVEIHNEGPVTLMLDSTPHRKVTANGRD